MADFTQAVEKILQREGGAKVTNTTGDRGGLTKYGISQRKYPQLDIAHLTKIQACAIYKTDYWEKIRGDDLADQTVAEAIFDACVNIGVPAGSRMAQRIVGVVADGRIGKVTVAALNQADPSVFVMRYALQRIRYYARICTGDPTQEEFLLGWINRVLATTTG